MTRLTAMWIRNDPEVEALAYGPDSETGKFGLYIGSYDETPSGCRRPRPLLTGEPVHATAEDAIAAAKEIIRQVRDAKADPE